MFDNLVKLGRIKPAQSANASRMGPPLTGVVGGRGQMAGRGQMLVGGQPAFIGGLSQANGGHYPYGPATHFGGGGVGSGMPSAPHQQPVERIIPIQVLLYIAHMFYLLILNLWLVRKFSVQENII